MPGLTSALQERVAIPLEVLVGVGQSTQEPGAEGSAGLSVPCLGMTRSVSKGACGRNTSVPGSVRVIPREVF